MNGSSQREDHSRAAEVSVLIAAEIIVALVVWLLTRSTVGVVIAVVLVLALYLVLMLFPEARRALRTSLGSAGAWSKRHPIPVVLLASALVAGIFVPLIPQPCGPPLASPLTEVEAGEGRLDCAGVTDGDDGPGVFGERVAPVMRAIKRENDRVEAAGGYVTIAFMTELAEGSPTAARAVNELKGAFVAQVRANRGGLIESLPPIRLVVANMGRDERRWGSVVRDLKDMTGAPDRLVAVTGLGVSVRETLMATRALSAAGIPMVGDVITADGFNATGKVDPLRRGPIPGLFRIPFEVGRQFAVIEKSVLASAGGGRTALLVEDEFNGDPHRADLYARSLGLAFREGRFADWHENGGGEVNTFGGQGSTEGSLDSQFNQIADNLCAEPKDLVFYAGRARYLPNFIENLYQRSCSDTRLPPLTVITGSDASNLAGRPGLADRLAANRVTVLYAPLAHPGDLARTANFPEFLAEYGRWSESGFSAKDLDDGWAIMGHDAFLTAARGVRNAAVEENGQVMELPTPASVKIAIGNLTAKGSNTVPGATGDFTIGRATGDRAGGRAPIVHRLGGS